VDEAVGRLRLDGADDFANLVDVNLVRELRPEDDARRRELAPDGAGRLDAGEPRHLDVEHAQLRPLAESQTERGLAIVGLDDGSV
jgi:hypothetical protein